MGAGRVSWTWLGRLSWGFVAVVGAITLTQVLCWSGGISLVAVAQTMTPYLGVLLVPIIAIAIWRRALVLVSVAAAVGFVLLALAGPLVLPADRPSPVEGAAGLRVASVNLWYKNTRVGDVSDALIAIDADVIVLSEYTSEHQQTLGQTPLAGRYLHRIDVTRLGAAGIAVWSKWPLVGDPPPPTHNSSIDVTVAGPDGDVRLVAVHLPTPINNFEGWRSDRLIVEEIGRHATDPTLVIGDLNMSYWHPDFRRLLDAGYVDAHIANGEGFATSWPTTWVVPPFVELDHALTIGGLASTDAENFDVPGSDHDGIVVTVAPTR